MKTNFFKRRLAFFLSIVLTSGSTPLFAAKDNVKKIFTVKKVFNSEERKFQKRRSNAENPLFSCFIIEGDQKDNFYIRKRRIYRKNSSKPIFGTITPDYLITNWKRSTLKCLGIDEVLPSKTKNPCNTLYPFLVSSLLRFVPCLLKPYQGEARKSPSTYYLSFAHSYRSAPASIFIHQKNLSKVLPNDNKLRDSLNEILSKTYIDSNNEHWTGIELATITIYLHAIINSRSPKKAHMFRDIAINKFKKMFEPHASSNISNMADPLIDIYYKTSHSKNTKDYSGKKIPQAYKNFYLDIVKAIDPARAHLFQLLDDTTDELKLDNTNKNGMPSTIIRSSEDNSTEIAKHVPSLEHKSNSGRKKNIIDDAVNLSSNNQTKNKLIRPVFTDMYGFPW